MAEENKIVIPIESTYNNKGEVEAKRGLKSLEKTPNRRETLLRRLGKKGRGVLMVYPPLF